MRKFLWILQVFKVAETKKDIDCSMLYYLYLEKFNLE